MQIRDKRRYQRVKTELQAYVIDVNDSQEAMPANMLIEAKTVDISNQGLQIQTPCRLKVGSYVMVLVYRDGKKSMCFCKVTRETENGRNFSYGLFFKEWCYIHPRMKENLVELPSWAQWAGLSNGKKAA